MSGSRGSLWDTVQLHGAAWRQLFAFLDRWGERDREMAACILRVCLSLIVECQK